jgi:hypothetical protein
MFIQVNSLASISREPYVIPPFVSTWGNQSVLPLLINKCEEPNRLLNGFASLTSAF